jgi:hypothetical protein
MSSPYHAGSRELQDRFDTRRLADRLDEKFLARPIIDADDRAPALTHTVDAGSGTRSRALWFGRR